MKRYGLLLATFATLVAGAWSLCAAGWFSRPVPAAASSDAAILSAAWRYHQCNVRHWRHCLLQR